MYGIPVSWEGLYIFFRKIADFTLERRVTNLPRRKRRGAGIGAINLYGDVTSTFNEIILFLLVPNWKYND